MFNKPYIKEHTILFHACYQESYQDAEDLDHIVCGISPFGGHHYPTIEPPEDDPQTSEQLYQINSHMLRHFWTHNRTRPVSPTVSLSHQEASISPSSLLIRGWTE